VATTPGARLALFALLALGGAWRPLGQAGGMNDFRDAHLLHSYEEAAVRTVREHGQLPLWSPWSCGGMDAWGNPQTRHASPTLLVSVALGARRAEPVLLFLFLVLGMEGAYRYARRRTGSSAGALLAAPLFGLCGFSALAWTLGWLNFLGFLLLPWLLLGTWWAARGRAAGAALVAGGFALMVGFGGTYPAPLCALFVAAEGLAALLSPPRSRTGGRLARGRVALALLATALLALGLCAFRLWPVAETLRGAPRVMAGAPGHTLPQVRDMLLGFPRLPGEKAGSAGIFHVGPVALALALLAPLLLLPAVWSRRPRPGGAGAEGAARTPRTAGAARRLLLPGVLGGLALWLATGYAAHPNPFALLRALPLFSTLRYPERFLFPLALHVAVLAALGAGALLAWAAGATGTGRAGPSSRAGGGAARGPWAVGVLLGVVAAAGWGVQVAALERLARRTDLVAAPPSPRDSPRAPFAQARGNRWAQGHVLALGRGSIACGEAYPVPMSPLLRGDLAAEEWLEGGEAAGRALRRLWSPNRLEVEVEARGPAVLRVNQNWHPGWRASLRREAPAGGAGQGEAQGAAQEETREEAGEVLSREGLLAVSVPPGRHLVTLRFLPRAALGGLAVSLLAALVLGGLVLAGASPRRPAAAPALTRPLAPLLALLPLLAWAALAALWHEPPPAPVLTNPDGSPLRVPSLPPHAQPLAARFGEGVELVGVHVPAGPDAEGLVPLELYWRVTGPVPRSAGIFVHVLGPDGSRKSADHALVGGTWFLAAAPRGELLRDAFAVSAHDWAAGRWEVTVGLWHAAGDGSRLPARGPAGAPVAEDRLPVGAFTVPPPAGPGSR
jgi:hypothetical protein